MPAFHLVPSTPKTPKHAPLPSPYGRTAGSPLHSPEAGEYTASDAVDYQEERERLRPPLTPVTTRTNLTLGSKEGSGLVTPARDPVGERPTLFASWIYEFMWIVVSIACFAVIVGVLLVFDDQPLPRLPLQITLNTFVAFFSTMSKAAFMLPITEAISQCKWNWFRTDRPLSDFETFDEASRGFWGSLALLFRVRWRNVASLGAIVTVLSVLSSPITQQVISYPTRLDLTSGLGNVKTGAVQSWAYDFDAGPRGVMNLVLSTVLTGFLQPIEKPIAPMDVACPTGTCTFPRFDSLGVCVKMANITHRLRVEEAEPNVDSWVIPMLMVNVTREYRVGLEEPCNMTSPSTMAFRTCTLAPNVSYAFADDPDLMSTKIYSFPIIYSMFRPDTFANISDPGPVSWGAFEAFFHLCVQSFDVSVEDGKPTTRVAMESWATPANNTNKPLSINCTQMDSQTALACYAPEEDAALHAGWIYLANPKKMNSMDQADYFGASRQTLNQLVDPIHFSAEGAFMYDPTDGTDNGWGIGSGFVQMIEALYNDEGASLTKARPLNPQLQMDRFHTILDNVATSITNTMRSAPAWMNGTTSLNSFAVEGSALVKETFVRVRWGWITYMACEILLAAVFLTMTVLYTRRLNIQVLKSSPLATLLALNGEARSSLGAITTAKRVRSNARAVKVNLVGNEIAASELTTSPVAGTPKEDDDLPFGRGR